MEKPTVPTDSAMSCESCDTAGANDCKSELLHRISLSDGFFKQQQRGDPDLTTEEKLHIASELLDTKPQEFLFRYGKYFIEEDLRYFQSMSSDYTIDFHLKEIKQRLDDKKNQTKIKNRRYEAMTQLMKKGEYFSDEEMKRRDPLLFEQLVGQYMSEDEVQAKVDKSDLTLSNILMRHMDCVEDNTLYSLQKDVEDGQMEEGESEEESVEEEEEEDLDDLPQAEKLLLRQELLRTMQHRFLAGQDTDFNYSEVDEDVAYDSMERWNQDAEDKYFQEDTDSLTNEITDGNTTDQ